MLANVSKQVQPVAPRHLSPEQIFAEKKASFTSADGVEVFEVGDNDVAVGVPEVIDTNTKHKPRPNDPCPCGSGKKYKKCHGA
jgi:preprotein translocase subunit SecA